MCMHMHMCMCMFYMHMCMCMFYMRMHVPLLTVLLTPSLTHYTTAYSRQLTRSTAPPAATATMRPSCTTSVPTRSCTQGSCITAAGWATQCCCSNCSRQLPRPPRCSCDAAAMWTGCGRDVAWMGCSLDGTTCTCTHRLQPHASACQCTPTPCYKPPHAHVPVLAGCLPMHPGCKQCVHGRRLSQQRRSSSSPRAARLAVRRPSPCARRQTASPWRGGSRRPNPTWPSWRVNSPRCAHRSRRPCRCSAACSAGWPEPWRRTPISGSAATTRQPT